ncbi:MAG TPA: PPOX class F420-dependent oxidoreductase [Kouleothrix sp.]|uniref:PPOX class F420-dependent oxidoreductase n=1 Tax=Kouleothrix sp. TaxID=2779161 RepID=UPI002CB04B93|nr:PPOX class F420-dependent oxidoreductase [Kouleothrix sp.]
MTEASQDDPAYFAPLAGADFMVLTTYRASGEAVPTTVWFAEVAGRVYVTTNQNLKKVARIRATPAVLVAPSDRVGNLQGPAVSGRARVLGPDEAPAAEAALRAKYGEMYTATTARMDATQPPNSRVFIEVTPP